MDDFILRKQAQSRLSPSSGPRLIIGAAVSAFLLGAAVTGFLAWRGTFDFSTSDEAIEAPAEPLAAQNQADSDMPEPTPMEAAAEQAANQAVERVTEQQGGLDTRIAALEQRIARLDLQAQAAAGNAARAEGLLIAFATRRSLERGDRLGYLSEQLRLRFGDAQPNAVNTLIEFAESPITHEQLLAQLDVLTPTLDEAPPGESVLDTIRREVGGLFIIRSEETPSPRPERRLERARRFMETGRASAAVAEVQALPGAQNDRVQAWIRNAERYAASQQALERIESAAILEPRNLRDGDGNRVEQPSPAGTG